MRFLTKRKNPFLVPLADNFDCSLVHVDVVRVELNEFAPPHSRAVQQFEDCSIAGAEKVIGIGKSHQFFDGEFVEKLRKSLFRLSA